jgi:hypothetical protein
MKNCQLENSLFLVVAEEEQEILPCYFVVVGFSQFIRQLKIIER